MASSEVEICNSALNKIGAQTILTLDDASKAARLCKKQHPLIRDEVLASHPWNFALTRAALGAADATAPAYEYLYAYPLPADCLRVMDTNLNMYPAGQTEARWEIENHNDAKHLITDYTEVKILYIKQITNVATFSAHFAEALAWRLGADLAYPLVNSTTIMATMFQIYDDRIKQARSYDGQEGSLRIIDANEWINVRF